MSNKIKKLIFTAASALAVAGMGVGVYAATLSIDATVTNNLISASFEYGQVGHTLEIKAEYVEYNPSTNKFKTGSAGNTAFGNNTGVACSKNASANCRFDTVDFTAKVDGLVRATLLDVKPEG